MVLSRLRTLAPAATESDPHRPYDAEGFPLTFPAMLEYSRRTWGDKTIFQQKARRQWTRVSANEIFERSQQIAAGLIAEGLQPGERVALILENSIDWLCAYYGIVVAGAVAVPMYYELKSSEIEEMIAHAEPQMAIVSAKAFSKNEASMAHLRRVIIAGETTATNSTPDDSSRRLTLEELEAGADRASREQLRAVEVCPDDLASIVFTSGTTGGSKGVMLTHRNFLANCWSIQRSIPFGERDRLVMVLPMHHAFPFTVTAVVAPVVGGEVTFENDLRRIRDRMAEVKPTLFAGVPALFELMYRNVVQRIETEGRLETFERGLRICETTKQRTGINIGRIVFRELHKRLGGSLRFMISGGAALNPEVSRNFARLGIPVLQGWGLTESAPVLSVQRWNPRKFYMSNYYEEHIGTVGQPLEGIEIGMIDVPEKELYVHLHGEGELVARGDNITPGYWRSEDATKAAKVDEWLRTGDVGYLDAEGNIWITGRSKYVIVLDSGEKVHPDEVEEKLGRSPLFEDLAVVPRKVRGKVQVWAVIYPHRDEVLRRLGTTAATEETVRALIKSEIDRNEATLAAYKRTTDFMLSDTPLPKTALRDIARGQIADSYSFDPQRWQQSWEELAAAATGQAAPEQDEALTPAS